MLNQFHGLPSRLVLSGLHLLAGREGDVAASVRDAYRAGIRRLFAELEALGFNHKAVAKELKISQSAISALKNGSFPVKHMHRLDELIKLANEHLPASKRVEPADLFRPVRREDETLDEILARLGYEKRRD